MSDERVNEETGEAVQDRGDSATGGVHEAQEAHGGSMAPGLVDDTGHPLAQSPPTAERA